MSAEASSSGSTSNAHASVLMPSDELPNDAVHVKGPDLSNPITLEDLLKSYETIGFQATGLARAIQVVEEMVSLSTSLKCKLTIRENAGLTQINR
jgi:deoxyhypusine synthase